MKCKNVQPVVGCLNRTDGTTEQVFVHFTYALNANGVEILESTRYTDSIGTALTLQPGETVIPGPCSAACCPEIVKTAICFESNGVQYKGWEVEGIDPETGSTVFVKAIDRARTIEASSYTVFDCPCGDSVASIPLAVDDLGYIIQVGEVTTVSTALNDIPCPAGELTDWRLVIGSEVNATVTPSVSSDGAFDVVSSFVGDWTFDYDIYCDGQFSGQTATVSGTSVVYIAATDDELGERLTGQQILVDSSGNDLLCPSPEVTTWDIVPGSVVNATVVPATMGTTHPWIVTPLVDGDFEFYYELVCDGTPTGEIARVYGEAVTPSIAVLKEADVQGLGVEGDTILYTFTVTNDGTADLTNITISDPLVTVVGGPIDLLVGQSDATTFTASYVITAADIVAGTVTNQATATGTPPNGLDDVTSVSDDPNNPATDMDPTVVIVPETAIELLKEAITIPPTVGSTFSDNFEITVPNGSSGPYVGLPDSTGSGNVWDTISIQGSHTFFEVDDSPSDGIFQTIHNTTNDQMGLRWTANSTGTIDSLGFYLANNIGGPAGSLDYSFEIERATLGDVIVTSGTAITGAAVPVTIYFGPYEVAVGDTVTLYITNTVAGNLSAQNIGVTFTELIYPEVNLGDTIDYNFTVTNTGVVDLTNVTVTDPNAVVSGGPIPLLAAGATDTTTFTAQYILTQSDIDNGSFTNQATVVGTNPDGLPVTDLSDDPSVVDGDPNTPTVVDIIQTPSISLLKEANVNGLGVEGDTIDYTFTVENTGNVTLTNITIVDPLVSVLGGPITLAPAQIDNTTFTAVYTITAADVLTGEVTNQATVTGTPPNGLPDVTDLSDDPSNPNSDDDPTVVIVPESDIALLKEAINIECTNCVTSPVAIDLATGTAPVGTLDPNWQVQWIEATAPYLYDPSGYFNDPAQPIQQAYVIGKLVGAWGAAPAGSDWISFDFSYLGGLNGAGAHRDVDQDGIINEFVGNPTGDNVQLRFFRNINIPQICNGPNVSLDITMTSDNQIKDVIVNGVSNGPANDTGFNPITYTISQGWKKGNNLIEVIVDSGPDLVGFAVTSGTINCEACDCPDLGVGGVIDYQFTVTNTGVVDLTNVTVTDPNAVVTGGPIPTLAAGASDSTTFTATHVLTLADVEAGEVINTATVTGTNPDSLPVADNSNEVIVDIPQNPAMTVEKVGTIDPTGNVTGFLIGGVMTPIAPGGTLTLDNGATVTLNPDNTVVYDRLPFDVTQNFVADNVNWTLPSISDTSVPSYTPDMEQYDARSLTYTGLQGVVVEELTFNLDVSGTYDDSVALDLTGDGTIDYVITQGDFEAVIGPYAGPWIGGIASRYYPWDDASPLQFVVSITPTGTTVTCTWAGYTIIPGGYGPNVPPFPQDPGFDNTAGITLADLGYNADGSIPSNSFTTSEIRMGTLNDAGLGFHNITWQLPDVFEINDPYTFEWVDSNGTIQISDSVFIDENTTIPLTFDLNQPPSAGDTISYTFVVTNTGNVDLTNIQINDPLVAVVGGPIDLLVGDSDSTTFTASYTLTQSDMYAGEVINQATVTGSSPQGTDDVTADSTGTVTCNEVLSTLTPNISDPDLGPYTVDLGIGGDMSFIASGDSRFAQGDAGADGVTSLVMVGDKIRTNIIGLGGFPQSTNYTVTLDVNLNTPEPAKLALFGGDVTSGGFVNHYNNLTLTWAGGTAELIDPDNQLVGGSRFINSGEVLVPIAANPPANSVTWEVVFPQGVTDVNIVAPAGRQLEVFYWGVYFEDCVADAPSPTVTTFPAEPLPPLPSTWGWTRSGGHFGNGDLPDLYDGNLTNGERLHHGANDYVQATFPVAYPIGTTLDVLWSNVQNPPILGIIVEFSQDGGASFTESFATPVPSAQTGDQWFSASPSFAWDAIRIRSAADGDGDDPFVREVRVNNIPN